MKLVFSLATALGAAGMAFAQTTDQPTFTRDVLPILQENCQECHRPYTKGTGGMVAPMSLMTYEEVRPWSKAIARAVSDKVMPPWFATEAYHNVFDGEPSITAEQRQTLASWAETGAQRGNPSDAPEPRAVSDSEWWNGEPDLVVNLPEPVWVGDEVEDWQPDYFVKLSEDQLPEDRWLKGLEGQGGCEVVHHIVVYKSDAAKPGSAASRRGFNDVNIGGLAPGAKSEFIREGYGIPVEKDTTLRISMHYHKEPGPGTGQWDNSRVGLYFWDEAEAQNLDEIVIEPIGNFDFEIPPGKADWFVGMARVFDRPFTIHSYLPHMHFRGAGAEYTAFLPDGSVEKLLDVPSYDYNWQLNYRYEDMRTFPAGTRVEVRMRFDNSDANEANPDSQRPIRFGLPTTEEMALGWMTYTWEDDGEAASD